MGILKSAARTALIPSVAISNVIIKGLQKATDKYAAKIGKESLTFKTSTTKEIVETKAGKALGVATAGVGAALVVASGAAGKVLSTTKGKIAGILTAGAASVSPKVTNAVIQAPAALFDLGVGIGGEVEKLPEEKTKDVGVGGLLLAGGVGLLTGAGIIAAKEAVKDISMGNQGVAGMLGSQDEIQQAGVITPQTQSLSSSTTKKRKKRRSKPSNLNVNQRVNIMLNQNIANKKYIKKFVQ